MCIDYTTKAENNKVVNYQQALEEIKKFNCQRGWRQEPADLAKSIVIEAAELLEHFQWDETDGKTKKDWQEISDEVADVFLYLVIFCYRSNIDLLKALENKLKKVRKKYPAEKFKNGHNFGFYNSQKKKYRKEK